MGGQGVVIIYKKGDVPVLRMETFEVIENVQSFLDLAIETQEVISCLEDLNPDVELSSGLNSDPFNREGVGYGVGYGVRCALDEDTEFTVFHLMADA